MEQITVRVDKKRCKIIRKLATKLGVEFHPNLISNHKSFELILSNNLKNITLYKRIGTEKITLDWFPDLGSFRYPHEVDFPCFIKQMIVNRNKK